MNKINKEKWTTYSFLKKIIQTNKWSTIRVIIIMLVNSMIAIILSHILVKTLDSLSLNNKIYKVLYYLLIYFGVALIQQIISYILSVFTEILTQRVSIGIKKDIIDQMFYKKGIFFSETKCGELMEIVNGDSNNISNVLTEMIFQTMANIFVSIGMIIYLAYMQWDLLIIILLIQPLVILIQKIFGKHIYARSEQLRKEYGDNISLSQEFISNALRFISLNLREYFLDIYASSLEKVYESNLRFTKMHSFNNCCINTFSTIIFILVIGIGIFKVSIGSMTIGMVIIFVQNSQQLLKPFFELSSIKIELERLKPSIFRISKILESGNTIDGEVICKDIDNIEFKNTGFSYYENNKVLSSFNAKFKKGNIYTIYGPSGIGKTTAFNLLLGLWDNDHGEILVNNIHIKNYTQNSLRDKITFVFQEDFVINDTLYNNVVLGSKRKGNITFDEAIKWAGLDKDFTSIDAMTKNIGESGMLISGGQRQRLSLARAYFRNTPVIILDEPSSSLDKENEQLLIKNIRAVSKDKIIIIISHSQNMIDSGDISFSFDELNKN